MNKSDNYINQFELALRCKYTSNATIRSYLNCFKSFVSYSKGSGLPIEELIKSYLVFGIKSKEPKTINLHRSAIVCFFKLVKKINITTIDVPTKKEKKRLPKIIPQDKIREAIRKTTNIKHRIQLMLFFDCGLRLCEMANLKRKNIFIENNHLWLQDTKGKKERLIPISPSVRILLYEFIDGLESDKLVFGGVCKRTIGKVVQSAFNRVGIKATPHMIRHSFATYQIASGENPFKVQQWLGHGNIKTTQTYITLSNAMLSEKNDLINENYMNFLGR